MKKKVKTECGHCHKKVVIRVNDAKSQTTKVCPSCGHFVTVVTPRD